MNELINVPAQTADVTPDVPPIMIPEKFVAAVFDPFKRKLAAAKRAAAKVEAYDITTGAGMGQAKELRASFRGIRTELENERKARKAPIIAAGKLLDSRAAELTAEIEPLEGKYDREIKAEEQRKADEKARKEALERERVEAIEKRIAHIRNAPGRVASADSATINREINQWTVLRLDPTDYQEYLEDALTAVNTTLEQLESLLASAQEREAEAQRVADQAAELARLKAEQAERDRVAAAEAAERTRLAQVERDKAEADRLAAAAREADLQRQLAEMKAMMEAQQRAANPAPEVTAPPTPAALVEVPLIVQGDPVVLGVGLAATGGDLTAEWIGDLPSMDELPKVEAKAEVDVVPRPSDEEIIDRLADEFMVSPATVIIWLRDLVKRREA